MSNVSTLVESCVLCPSGNINSVCRIVDCLNLIHGTTLDLCLTACASIELCKFKMVSSLLWLLRTSANNFERCWSSVNSAVNCVAHFIHVGCPQISNYMKIFTTLQLKIISFQIDDSNNCFLEY